ncbi:MAG: hypothetical protein GF353_28575 [Candidatus Lokiarchaeota archaeon]|nr:hypothetical protein [Candidatus Lokiarchaeota archaeon]MBD3353958.1 hypothetical protein [Candidatus Lokiarchaeota archaeon]
MGKVKKKSKGRIDKIEASNLILFTIFYALFLGILSGVVYVYVPNIIYVFDIIPIDVQKTVWVLGMALWGVLSILLGMKYKRD